MNGFDRNTNLYQRIRTKSDEIRTLLIEEQTLNSECEFIQFHSPQEIRTRGSTMNGAGKKLKLINNILLFFNPHIDTNTQHVVAYIHTPDHQYPEWPSLAGSFNERKSPILKFITLAAFYSRFSRATKSPGGAQTLNAQSSTLNHNMFAEYLIALRHCRIIYQQRSERARSRLHQITVYSQQTRRRGKMLLRCSSSAL